MADRTKYNEPNEPNDTDNEASEDKYADMRTTDAKTWQDRFDIAYNNQKSLFKKFAEWYEHMYAIKTYKNIGVWRSKAFIPIMSYKAWTIIAKLLAMRPGFSVKIFDTLYSDEDRKRSEKANLKLEHDYDNPELEESIRDRMFDSLSDAVICGTGFGLAPWTTGTKKVYNHVKKDDGNIDYGKNEVVETDYGYNDLQPINVFDVFGAPGKRNWQKKPWIIIKYAGKTRSDLLTSGLYDEETIKNLSPVSSNRDTITKYKQSRNQLIGTSKGDDQDNLDDTTDTFDIYECMEKTPDGVYLCTFAETAKTAGDSSDSKSGSKGTKTSGRADNSHWENIREEKQPYWHGRYPLITYYIRRRPHDCWGESIFEVTESMANAYNDIFNQFADNLNIVGNGGILMHETTTTIYDFYYGPGGEIRYSGTKPTFETPTSPDIQFFTTMMNMLDGAISNSTISPYASGTPADANDQTQGTAQGISKLQEAAGEIITFMKSNFMQSLKSLGYIWLSNNRQFLDEDMTLEQSKGGKRLPVKITRDDFTSTMVVTIDEASMQPATKDEKLAAAKSWLTDMFTIQDRSFVQAGMTPSKATGQVVGGQTPPVNPQTGQPVTTPEEAAAAGEAAALSGQPPQQQQPEVTPQKPIFFDLERIGEWLSDEYGISEFEQFLASTNNPQENTDLVNAIRGMVDDGDLDTDQAQMIIDQIEGRSGENATEPTAAAVQPVGGSEVPTGGVDEQA